MIVKGAEMRKPNLRKKFVFFYYKLNHMNVTNIKINNLRCEFQSKVKQFRNFTIQII